MAKATLVAEVRFGLAANRVSPVAAVLTARSLNVATPFCGVTVSVPPRPVPPARVRLIGLVAVGTALPFASSTTTCTAGARVAPVIALEGCCRKASLTGEEGGFPPPGALTLKGVLVAGRRFELAAVSVNPVAAALTLRLLKVATPFCGLTVSVPPKPVPPAREIVIGLAALARTFPLESSTSTWTAGEMVTPVCALDGCWVKASCAA
jgi:hypothetical protein